MQSPEYPDLPFVPPRAYGAGRDGKAVRFVVIHYTAGSERSSSAEDGAAYDRKRTDGTSTHYFVDSTGAVQCVRTTDRANAARSKGNRLGIQYELCGTVQTRAQWLDEASLATLQHAARQVARDCKRYGIPVRRLTVAETRQAWTNYPNGPKGLVGHVDCTRAFPEDGGDHTDPGPAFPWDVFLDLVQDAVNGDDDVSKKDVLDGLSEFFAVKVDGSAASGTQTSRIGKNALDQGIPNPFRTQDKTEAWRLLSDMSTALIKLQAAVGVENAEIVPTAEQNAAAVLAGLRGSSPEETAAALRAVLGDRSAEVGRILAQQ